jgi:hypothetical protein
MAEENDSERDDEESSDSEPDNDSTDSPNDGDGGDSGDVDAEFGQSESSEDLDRRSEREAEAEARQLEREAEALEGDGSMAALLGPERWVQFAFIAAGVALFFLADRLSTLIWGSSPSRIRPSCPPSRGRRPSSGPSRSTVIRR